jgi:hypothetical protein
MPLFKDAALERELKRWMRSDAGNFLRPDWRRFVKPGSDAAAVFGVYEQKYRPDQLRDELGRWTDEGGGVEGGTQSPAATGEPTAGSGRSDPRVLSDATPDNYYKPGAQLAVNEGQASTSQDRPARDAGRISNQVASECEEMHRRDLFICKAFQSPACYTQAYLRYTNCQLGRPIPPLNF